MSERVRRQSVSEIVGWILLIASVMIGVGMTIFAPV
jgi:hypothetical protein